MRPSAGTMLVWTGGPCSYGCATCPIDQRHAPPGLELAGLHRALSSIPPDAGRLVILVGGEPFIRPDFPRLMALIRAAGRIPGIVTTGRPLVYPQWRERLRRAELGYLRLQLFGTATAHDQATAVAGSFDQALAGLHAWAADAGADSDIDVVLNVRGPRVDAIVDDIEALSRAVPHTENVRLVIALDPGLQRLSLDAAPLQSAVAAVSSWNDDPHRPPLTWEGLPPSTSVSSLLQRPPLRPDFIAVTPAACCLGSIADLAAAADAGAPATRANSFNYLRTATTVPYTVDANACQAHRAAAGIDPARQLWLIEDERLVLHVTDTGDFSAVEIGRVKDEWSHLFLDRQALGVLDDFIHGMRRVLPDPTCATCPHRLGCGRRFQVVDGPPFARQEAWIAGYVADLRGRVLDVGCGEQLYRDVLAPLVGSGQVAYTGLDPDVVSLERIRAALPQGRFYVGGIEDFHDDAESYDQILCLRALNHVVDVDVAVGRMAGMLRPGGSLLIVEMTPFAMLRRSEQVAAADSAPRAGHQHFRNVASDEVLPFTRRHGLRVVDHQPARFESTNEWILLLEKPARA